MDCHLTVSSPMPLVIHNWIDGRAVPSQGAPAIDKFDPHTGELLCRVTNSTATDVADAVAVAKTALDPWRDLTAVRRGQLLTDLVACMKRQADALAQCIATETGKPPQDARGEVGGAILQGEYWASEGMRLHGRTLTSGMPGKHSHTIRQARGVAGLIVPANTPIANIAWKAFPALICGNTVVMKASEDAPRIAMLFAELTREAGIPDGVFNVIQGLGRPAGAALVEHSDVAVISFTGSTPVGRWIAEVGGRRLARVSLELGGKNPFVVCDDADLDQAVHWATLSAFSNAGQRCAAGSRLLVFRGVYDSFCERLVDNARRLTLGTAAGCDLGPLVSRRQQQNVLAAIARARAEGGRILCGGMVPEEPALAAGNYVQPTVIDGLANEADLICHEVFGPVVTVQPVDSIADALHHANATEYGLTSAIHTRNIDRALWFAHRVRAGVCNINIGTYGSEPHMPFGGFGASGNGTREPGVEALDVYSELKNISTLTRSPLI
jgi:alpha-ketoglutaric semialdehyde dehydrogenase